MLYMLCRSRVSDYAFPRQGHRGRPLNQVVGFHEEVPLETWLSIETMKKSIETAFLPLECVVEVSDYGQRVGFRVYGPQQEHLLTVEDILSHESRHRHGLTDLIESARRKVAAKGYELRPWAAPQA